MYFSLTAYLSWELPHFKCLVATCISMVTMLDSTALDFNGDHVRGISDCESSDDNILGIFSQTQE